jgi:hypothetical protein
MKVRWHVREIARVDDDELASEMNAAHVKGWLLQRVDYIREAGVRRPVMAFLFFTSDEQSTHEAQDAGQQLLSNATE